MTRTITVLADWTNKWLGASRSHLAYALGVISLVVQCVNRARHHLDLCLDLDVSELGVHPFEMVSRELPDDQTEHKR